MSKIYRYIIYTCSVFCILYNPNDKSLETKKNCFIYDRGSLNDSQAFFLSLFTLYTVANMTSLTLNMSATDIQLTDQSNENTTETPRSDMHQTDLEINLYHSRSVLPFHCNLSFMPISNMMANNTVALHIN